MIDIKPAGDPWVQEEEPHLLGVHEIVELLFRISRDRVAALTCRDDFPAPIADLAAGAVWDRTDVEAWLAQHGDAVTELLKDT